MKQRIGDRYEFDRATDIIGKGGMGTVYVGLDTATGQKVAIKQLKPDIIEENPDFVERFNREAEALRRLNHPNIVTVLDTIADDDAHYLIMEYVAGGSLWDEMEKNKQLPIPRVLQIALDLSDALTRAHRLKIIHRDLKPANILIAEDGTPRLTDFGVAQLGDKTRVTRTGAVVGTLNYLSPEALNGETIDERTDIWAFGVMLYEMLAGHNPFPEESATALVTAILTKPIADMHASRPDVHASVVRLLEQMLTKDRTQRIDSVRKVGSELEDIIRYADSDDDLAIAIKPELLSQHTGRFDTPTPNSATPNTLHPATSKPSPSKPMMTVMKSDTGEEYVVMPKRYANRVRLLFVIMPLAIIGIIIFIITRPRADGGDTNITIVRPRDGNGILNNGDDIVTGIMPPVETVPEGYYPVAVLPGTSPDDDDPEIQMEIVEGLRQALQTDISFSNIRVVSESARMQMVEADVNSTLPIMTLNTELNTQAGLIILPEEREDGLHVFIQLGDLARFPYNSFERTVLERLINVELVVESPSDIAPYVVGALAILHSAGGDMFEFMRTMTILSQLPASNATMVSAGTSASVHGYFANFINDEDEALELINAALDRDGGNAMLFMYRSLIYLRQFNFDSASSDIISAQRLGPSTWALPLYAIGIFSSAQERITTLEQVLAIRPDDWFAYYMMADNYYTQGDLESTREALDNALARDPKMNVVHLLSFVVALRQGRLTDGGQLLNDLLTQFPDPNFSYRVMNAAFGDAYSVSILLYSSLANLIIGQFDRVIEDTATVLSFVNNPEAFIQDKSQLPGTMTTNPSSVELSDEEPLITPYFYASDLFMIRGIAFCSLGRFEEAIESYSIGLGIDPTNHMLRLLRSEIYFLNGDMVNSQADINQAMGLSDEMDAFILEATNADGVGEGLGCTSFFDIFSQMGQGE